MTTAQEIIAKYHLTESSWTHKGFHGILHFFFPVGEEAVQPLKAWFGDGHRITVFFFSHDECHWYWHDGELRRLREEFWRRYRKEPKTLAGMVAEWKRRMKILDEKFKKMRKAKLIKVDDTKLYELYREFYDAYLAEYGISIGIQDAFSMKAEEFVTPMFQKELPAATFNEHYRLLVSPLNDSFVTQERRDLLKIVKQYQQKEDVTAALKRHAKKWFWVQNNYAKTPVLDEQHFRRELERIAAVDCEEELAALKRRIPELRKKKRQLIRTLKISDDLRALITLMESFAYMQDERKKYVLLANHHMNLFVEELARRTKLDRKLVEYSYVYETPVLLAGKIDLDVLRQRRDFCLCIHTMDGYEVVSGDAAKEVYEKVFAVKAEGITELQGMAASPGVARGRAKIVLKTHDLANFAQGDILVASMTRPEMVVAMQKAAAIVTDEGGITSHAAIISRELKIPCVIGTGKATRVFKDGDLVEVDAEKGTVRKVV